MLEFCYPDLESFWKEPKRVAWKLNYSHKRTKNANLQHKYFITKHKISIHISLPYTLSLDPCIDSTK